MRRTRMTRTHGTAASSLRNQSVPGDRYLLGCWRPGEARATARIHHGEARVANATTPYRNNSGGGPARDRSSGPRPAGPVMTLRGRTARPKRGLLLRFDQRGAAQPAQLSLAPSRIQVRIASRSQTDNCLLLCGMRNWGDTLQSSSRIRLLLSGSPGTTIGPYLVPAITPLYVVRSRPLTLY